MNEYFNDVENVYKILSHEENTVLFDKWQKDNDIKARNTLIEGVLPLIIRQIKIYENPNYHEDKIARANLFVLENLHKWEPSRGSLSNFVIWIMKSFIFDNKTKEFIIYIPKMTGRLSMRISDEELEKLDKARRIDLKRARNILKCTFAGGIDLSSVEKKKLHDPLKSFLNIEDSTVRLKQYAKIHAQLTPQQQEVISLRFFEGLDFRAIGKRLKLTYQRIQQIYQKTIERIRLLFRAQFSVQFSF